MEKRNYISPEIEIIELDNAISLALESDPPALDNETSAANIESLSNKPFFT